MAFSELIHRLEPRHLAGAGFADHAGGGFRADATCWATLALNASGRDDNMAHEARQALARVQSSDGRVCLTPLHENAWWPTPLAVLAWHRCGRYRQQRDKAVRFLLDFDQLRIVDDADTPAIVGHDPTIRGWPWIVDTTPWVEPTAYCLLALRLAGFEGHARTQEGRRLILNRQLSTGGWNYGNTTVYGQELRPTPETTGVALQAIAGLASLREVAKSIDYLRSQLPRLHTPFALAWAILGLAAWRKVENSHEQMVRILGHQDDYTAWDTVTLSLLLLAWHCPNGLLDWLRQLPEEVPP
jgi:hypothetical protein